MWGGNRWTATHAPITVRSHTVASDIVALAQISRVLGALIAVAAKLGQNRNQLTSAFIHMTEISMGSSQ
jgi:hypothetical protein